MEMIDYINRPICPCATESLNQLLGGFSTGRLSLLKRGPIDEDIPLLEAVHAANLGKKVLYITTNFDDLDIMHVLDKHNLWKTMKKENLSIEMTNSLALRREFEFTVAKACEELFDLIIVDDLIFHTNLDSLRSIIRGGTTMWDELNASSSRSYPCLVIFTPGPKLTKWRNENDFKFN